MEVLIPKKIQSKKSKYLLNQPLVIILLIGVIIGLLISQGFSKYVFILYAGFGFVVLSFINPLKALFVYIILYPLLSTFSISLGKGIPDISFNRAAVLIILAAVLLRTYFGKTNLKSRTHVELWMLIFCFLATVSMFLNYNTDQFTKNMLFFMDSFIIPFLLFFLAKNLFSKEEHIIQLMKVLIILAIYLSIIGIYEQITWHDLFPVTYSPDVPEYVRGLRIDEESGILRVNGPFGLPETFGVVTAMILIVLSYNISPRNHHSNTNHLLRWLSIFVMPLLGVGLYFNMLRGTWLGAFAGIISRYNILKGQRLKIIMSITIIVLLAWVGSEKIQSTTVYRARISNVQTFYARVATYKSAIAMFLDNPIFGVGFNNFVNTYESHNYLKTFRGISSVKEAHNSYLRLLAENGILGFSAFIFILGYLFIYVIKLYNKHGNIARKQIIAVYLGVLVMIIVPSFFDTTMLFSNVNNLFYLLMGSMISTSHDTK